MHPPLPPYLPPQYCEGAVALGLRGRRGLNIEQRVGRLLVNLPTPLPPPRGERETEKFRFFFSVSGLKYTYYQAEE